MIAIGPGCGIFKLYITKMQARGSIAARSAPSNLTRASRRSCVSVSAANVLIANTKGGGHAFIGLYLAKELISKGHTVTILNDGDGVRVQPVGKLHVFTQDDVRSATAVATDDHSLLQQ